MQGLLEDFRRVCKNSGILSTTGVDERGVGGVETVWEVVKEVVLGVMIGVVLGMGVLGVVTEVVLSVALWVVEGWL